MQHNGSFTSSQQYSDKLSIIITIINDEYKVPSVNHLKHKHHPFFITKTIAVGYFLKIKAYIILSKWLVSGIITTEWYFYDKLKKVQN